MTPPPPLLFWAPSSFDDDLMAVVKSIFNHDHAVSPYGWILKFVTASKHDKVSLEFSPSLAIGTFVGN